MSEFWKKKLRTYISVIDLDQDGYISEDDFVGLARSLAENLNADPEKKAKAVESFSKVWKLYMKSGHPEKGDRLTVDIFAESLKQQRYDPDLMAELVGMYRNVFDILDVNKDGFLQPEEHKRIYDNAGIPEDRFNRRKAFDALDTNHDGVISFNEFISGVFEYFFSEDEGSLRKPFYGPLVD